MKKQSIWEEVIDKRSYPKLDKDIKTDVLIIGGGMTGVNTCYQLLDNNLKICLVDRNLIGSGVTSRTTGKLTYLQEDMASKIAKYYGTFGAKTYVMAQREAINIVKDIIKLENIDCNLKEAKSYLFSQFDDNKLEKEKEVLEKIGVLVSDEDFSFKNSKKKALVVYDTYVFHAVKYVRKLADICSKRGALIFEDSKIIKIEEKEEGYICHTNNNVIKSKYVVLACSYPYFLNPFWLFLKSYIEKSNIEAFLVDKNDNFSAISIDGPIKSIRYFSDKNLNYQLYLSNSHNAAIKNNEKKNFSSLLKGGEKVASYMWSNKDIMTIDKLPYIGRIKKDRNLLIGTGYNTWGMTNSILASRILSDIILERENKYIEFFSPLRKIGVKSFINLPVILGSSFYSFFKTKIFKNKKWYSSGVKFIRLNGKNIGVYIDEEGCKHLVYNKCPHMKCGLIFNEVEKTWDCPCHGSRFDIDGKCIEGPSNYDISYRE